MTLHQRQKKQIKAILGSNRINATLTLSELAQEVILAIHFNKLQDDYPEVLSAAISVIKSAGSNIDEPVGGKAFSIFAKIVKEKS